MQKDLPEEDKQKEKKKIKYIKKYNHKLKILKLSLLISGQNFFGSVQIFLLFLFAHHIFLGVFNIAGKMFEKPGLKMPNKVMKELCSRCKKTKIFLTNTKKRYMM